MMMKRGIISTTPGIAITATTSPNTNYRPTNRIRARAYPASEQSNTRPSTTVTVTITEFSAQQRNLMLPRLSPSIPSIVQL